VEQAGSVFITYIIPATVLLGVLIFVHELGHCIVAKLCGVRVLKFSLGFGPKLFSKKIGDTEYMLSLLPLGGYVKPLGESSEEKVAEEDLPYSLTHQSIPRRFAVLAAGSVFNILFAACIFAGVYMYGMPALAARVGTVVDGSPAQAAGMRAGDVIESINGKKIELWEELSARVQKSRGLPLKLIVLRDGERVALQVTPRLADDEDLFGDFISTYKIGITSPADEDAVIVKRYYPPAAVWKGVQDTWKWSKLTLIGLGVMAKSPIERRKDIGGPILIGKLAGDFAQVSMMSFILLMAMISVNLGVLNLLPIPILDGGHIFFLLIEAIKGSPVSMKRMEVAQQIGLALLLGLMVIIFYNDLTRFFPQ
jgi:regulator of sigma E protease